MNRRTFEQRLLHLWMTSRVPFTTANLQFYTGVERAKLERWLDELVASGMLELDSDDAGELIWTVTGAARPAKGATQVTDVVKLEQLRSELPSSPASSAGALIKRDAAQALAGLGGLGGGSGQKSLLASGALSFFLGPLGWLYAAPLKDALPGILVWMALFMLLPHFLLAPLVGILAPLSAGLGVFYAWQHNQRGERTSLTDSARRTLPPRR